ncbi:endopeptidase, partial [Clostridium botulinum]|nr:endopeptidase [Clostridium botulinum]
MRSITNVIAGSEEDSFLNIWGGEIECNNYNLNIPLKRGKDRGIRVTFGYNLEDIEEEINSDTLVTRIYPYSGELVLGGNTPYIDSPLIDKYEDVYEQQVEMSDIKVKEDPEDKEGFNTEEEARNEMIKRCKKLYENGVDKIKANYKVNMANLKKTMEYKKYGYDVLEKICLGDTVHCYNKNIDI